MENSRFIFLTLKGINGIYIFNDLSAVEFQLEATLGKQQVLRFLVLTMHLQHPEDQEVEGIAPHKLSLAFILRSMATADATSASEPHCSMAETFTTAKTQSKEVQCTTQSAPTPSATPASATKSGKKRRQAPRCKTPECTNFAINKGLCFRHGGGKECSVDGCGASAKIGGRCWKHGGSIQCVVDGCERRGKTRGLCWSHGGGTKCNEPNCTKVAVSNHKCWAHGGGRRCNVAGCKKAAYQRMHDFCAKHYELLKDGQTVFEL